VETLRYGEREKEMLTSVAPYIAMAIEQVQAEKNFEARKAIWKNWWNSERQNYLKCMSS
jgi:GAF domain-containing protein